MLNRSSHLAQAQLQLQLLTVLVSAEELKEYGADWLKNVNIVVRDSSGKFASKASNLATQFEISNWLDKVTPDLRNVPGREQAEALLDEVKSGLDKIKAAPEFEQVEKIASQVIEKGIPAATYIALTVGPDIAIGLTLGESLPIVLGGVAAFAAIAKVEEETLKAYDINNPWVKGAVNLSVALITADIVRSISAAVKSAKFGAQGVYKLTEAGKTAEDLKATCKAVRGEIESLAKPAKTLLEEARRDRFLHSLALTSERSEKSIGQFFKNLSTYTGGLALRSKLKVSTFQEAKGVRHDIHLDGKNVGYAFVQNRGDRYWLESLEVHPDYQKNGLGSFLLEKVTQHYKDKPLELRANPFNNQGLPNNKLLSFYAKRGFLIVEETQKGVLMRFNKAHHSFVLPTPSENLARYIEKELGGLNKTLEKAGVNVEGLGERLAEMSDLSSIPLLLRNRRIKDVKSLVERVKETAQKLDLPEPPEIKQYRKEYESLSDKFDELLKQGNDQNKIVQDLDWINKALPLVDKINEAAAGPYWRARMINTEVSMGEELDAFVYGIGKGTKELGRRYEAFLGHLVQNKKSNIKMVKASEEEIKLLEKYNLPGEEAENDTSWASREIRDKIVNSSENIINLFGHISPHNFDIKIDSLGWRAFAIYDETVGNFINAGRGGAHTLFHELGHIVEDVTQPKGMGFVQSSAFRAARKIEEGYEDLKNLGMPGEMVIKDTFVHPYTGKVYPWFSTEVVSTGLENLAVAESLHKLAVLDREHLTLALSYLRP